MLSPEDFKSISEPKFSGFNQSLRVAAGLTVQQRVMDPAPLQARGWELGHPSGKNTVTQSNWIKGQAEQYSPRDILYVPVQNEPHAEERRRLQRRKQR